MTTSQISRRFVPADFDPSQFEQIQPLYAELLQRAIGSPAELEAWLLDWHELSASIDEYGSRRYIDKTSHTDDPQIEKAFLHYVEEIEPRVKPLFFEAQKKFLGSQHRDAIDPSTAMLVRNWQADVDLFREENIPLETQITRLNNEYDKLCGAMMVNVRGREVTLQQAGRFLEEQDRTLRQEAWEQVSQRRLADRDRFDDIYEQLLPLRARVAANAGMPDYRAYAWKSNKRFDYTPEDCLLFADAIAEVCVPVVAELDRRRRQQLGLERLRPWDMAVDPKNRPPLRPFADGDEARFVGGVTTIFERLSPELAAQFDSLRRNNNLDLSSRKGKQPGGYQDFLRLSRQPFIFMNAAGMQRDLDTLLHEGGHAFHSLAASATLPLGFLWSSPMEFAEVASMGMELLGLDHLDVFYPSADDAARARRQHLEGIVRFLPWMATIDSFQHWIYTHPDHTRDERRREWLRLMDRFGGDVDYSGFEEARASRWQSQIHLFHYPFYYIEYGIAQLGALQLWMKARMDPARALANYRSALRLGGSRPLPDLFAAAGLRFDLSRRTLEPLINAVREELAQLPE